MAQKPITLPAELIAELNALAARRATTIDHLLRELAEAAVRETKAYQDFVDFRKRGNREQALRVLDKVRKGRK
jgi:hypothetical protein